METTKDKQSSGRLFVDRCDKCHVLVIDDVLCHDEYTVTEVTESYLKIHFYCPACIKKLGIVTDAMS